MQNSRTTHRRWIEWWLMVVWLQKPARKVNGSLEKGRKDGRKHVWMCIIIIAVTVCLIIVLWAQIETLKCAHSLTRSLWYVSKNFASEHCNNVVRFVKWSSGTQMSYGLMYDHSSVTSNAKWNCHLFSSGTFDIFRHLGQSNSHLDCFMCVCICNILKNFEYEFSLFSCNYVRFVHRITVNFLQLILCFSVILSSLFSSFTSLHVAILSF